MLKEKKNQQGHVDDIGRDQVGQSQRHEEQMDPNTTFAGMIPNRSAAQIEYIQCFTIQ